MPSDRIMQQSHISQVILKSDSRMNAVSGLQVFFFVFFLFFVFLLCFKSQSTLCSCGNVISWVEL